MSITNSYEKRYQKKSVNLYPTEFVLRWFKGTYPTWKMSKMVNGGKILDLGFGDGRNIQLFLDLGLDVYGAEISQNIVNNTLSTFDDALDRTKFKVGKNGELPFLNNFFDYVVACHSLYYLSDDNTLSDNFNEVSRCMKNKAHLLFSIPTADSYLIQKSQIIDEHHVLVKEDPLNLRNGTKIGYSQSLPELERLLLPYFDDIIITSAKNDWWGIKEYCWLVSCRKSGN